MNLQEQHIIFDIDNTITRYCPQALLKQETLHGNCFMIPLRDLMIARGWEKEAAEKAIYERTYDVLRWDYSDLIHEFNIPWDEAHAAMKKRHESLLEVYEETVAAIRTLKNAGAKVYIASNNPYWGCRWKLERAGLSAGYFEHIFSTDHTGGCKSLEYVWKFIIPRIGASPEKISVVGDDYQEDGVLPVSHGAGRAFILTGRGVEIPPQPAPGITLLANPMDIPEKLTAMEK